MNVIRLIGILFLSFLIFGCVDPAFVRMESNASDGYYPEAKSLYVISHLLSSQPEFDQLIGVAFTKEFGANGYGVDYVTSNGLELDDNMHLESALNKGHRLILVINPNGGVKSGSVITYAKYEVKVFDIQLKKVVFKSSIGMYPTHDFWIGFRWDQISADKLAKDILNELKYKKII